LKVTVVIVWHCFVIVWSRELGSQMGWQLGFAVYQVGQQVLKGLARLCPAYRQQGVADLPCLPGIQCADRNIHVYQ